MPVGAYGGRKEIMDLISPCGPVYQAGTLSGNPVAMAAGLICGMGYLGFALLFSLILGLVMYGLNHFAFPQKHPQKILRITIPEDLYFSDVFDDIFTSYTSTYNLISVKTSNMGSLFKLQYHVTLKDDTTEKAFIDALRCRNGNLENALYQQEVDSYVL